MGMQGSSLHKATQRECIQHSICVVLLVQQKTVAHCITPIQFNPPCRRASTH